MYNGQIHAFIWFRMWDILRNCDKEAGRNNKVKPGNTICKIK